MMFSAEMNKKLNEQITNEFNASQIYLAMACMFDNKSLSMLAKHFRRQTEEEREHALKLLDYVLEQDGKVELQPLPAPPESWPSVQAALEAALEHEKKVTAQINDLCTLAESEKDHATRTFLNWFVDEQVEEVSSASQLADAAKMCGNQLMMLEAYLIHLAKGG